MELSSGSPNSQDYLKFTKSRRSTNTGYSTYLTEGDVDTIDISSINFENDESWLCTCDNDDPIEDLNAWLHKDQDLIYKPYSNVNSHIDLQKNVDSRTFTRPKKRFTRPSIERYNEEMYGSSSETITIQSNSKNFVIEENPELGTMPTENLIDFDFSQPSSSYYFEKILADSGAVDSFQNMSPPSLVNSMCSSTFANLMESSFIKNDPILREIRDTDYSDSVLLQDSEAPMFQSITESCSSINSDTPENFLKKVSINATFKRNAKDGDSKQKMFDSSMLLNDADCSDSILLQDSEPPMFQSFTESFTNANSDSQEHFLKKVSFNGTFQKNAIQNDNNKRRILDATFDKPIEPEKEEETTLTNTTENLPTRGDETWVNPNGTYRRTPKHNGTFKKSDLRKNQNILNATFESVPQQKLNITTTHTLIKDCNGLEDMKRGLSDPIEINTDINRLSYCLENDHVKLDDTYNDVNRSRNNLKTSALSGSAGSADSLDRLSSMSSSSRGSNKMLNMADVDAIVEMQERSLQQVMSTPKTTTAPKRLWDNNFISPIVSSEPTSDSDLSSNEDYKSVRSTISSKGSLEQYILKQPKSLGYVGPVDTKIKANQKSSYPVVAPKAMPVVRSTAKTTSYSNLKHMSSNIPGSYSNIYKTVNAKSQSQPSTASNLKTMGSKLKGSYTSLRPISSNLPVAPPLISSNTTTTLTKVSDPQSIDSGTRIVEVQPMPREKITIVGDNTFVKPQQVKASGLPRPTGIPRPASRIPAPRSSNVRPKTWRSTYSKSEMKI